VSIRDQLEAFWSGDRPDRIPYTIYYWEWRHMADDPRWHKLYEMGLGVTWNIPTIQYRTTGVEYRSETRQEQGKTFERRTVDTPVGSIYETFVDGWRQKFMLETAQDYAVMTHLVRHTQVLPDYDPFLTTERDIAPHGVALVDLQRTPLQTILVDYVGLENLAYHLVDREAEVLELYDALLERFRRAVDIVAEGPGRCISVLENFTAETLGPRRYEQFLLPVYEECFPTLQSAGKIISVHYDGKLAACQDVVARAPINVIESLTPPPEGDMTLAQARAAWPDLLFWSNVNVACYHLPPEDLKALVRDRVCQAAPDGRKLAFEVSEHSPTNWPVSMPVVLEALREIA
jgi:hypothetical protein